jgi:hypothetical protein
MRPFVLGAVLLLSGCYSYEQHSYPVGGPPPPSAPARRIIDERQAVDTAFRLCQDRHLRVDRVERTSLDSAGRWHVILVGAADRAQLLLDGRDGRLLKGRFRQDEPATGPSPAHPGAQAPGVQPPAQPPTPPPASPPPPPAEPPPPADDLD